MLSETRLPVFGGYEIPDTGFRNRKMQNPEYGMLNLRPGSSLENANTHHTHTPEHMTIFPGQQWLAVANAKCQLNPDIPPETETATVAGAERDRRWPGDGDGGGHDVMCPCSVNAHNALLMLISIYVSVPKGYVCCIEVLPLPLPLLLLLLLCLCPLSQPIPANNYSHF